MEAVDSTPGTVDYLASALGRIDNNLYRIRALRQSLKDKYGTDNLPAFEANLEHRRAAIKECLEALRGYPDFPLP